MAEVLSQNQIDQLLSSLQTGDVSVNELEDKGPDKKIRPYDFKIPKKFTKEQLKTISIIYENYSRILSTYLSGMLRNYCQIEVLTIEEQRYFEYSNAMPESILMGVMEMKPLQGSAMITMSQSVAFAIIDRLLGGQGDPYEVDRDYTDIELTLIEKVIREMSTLLKDAWSNVYELTPQFIRLATNSRQSQLVSPNETVVIIMLDVKIKEVVGNISFCMPYVILEPVLEHLNTRYWFTERKVSDEIQKEGRKSLQQSMKAVPIELKAVLGKGHLSLHEIMDLRCGDVIELEQGINDKILIIANGNEWFAGAPGVFNNHKAVRVEKILLEGDIEHGSE